MLSPNVLKSTGGHLSVAAFCLERLSEGGPGGIIVVEGRRENLIPLTPVFGLAADYRGVSRASPRKESLSQYSAANNLLRNGMTPPRTDACGGLCSVRPVALRATPRSDCRSRP